MNHQSFEQEIRSVFLEEAREILSETEAVILLIESDPDQREHVERLFRYMHTLKGSGMVAGFQDLGAVAHAAESLMDGLRTGRCKAEPAVIEALLSSNDWMKRYVEASGEDAAVGHDRAGILQKIEAALTNAPSVPPPVTRQVPASPAVSVSTTGKKVLLCDDDEEILFILNELLTEEGFQVKQSTGGAEALDVLSKESIDVIITDLKMPEMDGIEFVQQVRTFNRYMPIIFVSGYCSREHLKTFLTLGVDRLIDKPFDNEEVISAVNGAVATKELRDSVFRLSNLSFRAYVTLNKILTLYSLPGAVMELEKEKKSLEDCMRAMREANIDLLNSEKRRRQS